MIQQLTSSCWIIETLNSLHSVLNVISSKAVIKNIIRSLRSYYVTFFWRRVYIIIIINVTILALSRLLGRNQASSRMLVFCRPRSAIVGLSKFGWLSVLTIIPNLYKSDSISINVIPVVRLYIWAHWQKKEKLFDLHSKYEPKTYGMADCIWFIHRILYRTPKSRVGYNNDTVRYKNQ